MTLLFLFLLLLFDFLFFSSSFYLKNSPKTKFYIWQSVAIHKYHSQKFLNYSLKLLVTIQNIIYPCPPTLPLSSTQHPIKVWYYILRGGRSFSLPRCKIFWMWTLFSGNSGVLSHNLSVMTKEVKNHCNKVRNGENRIACFN